MAKKSATTKKTAAKKPAAKKAPAKKAAKKVASPKPVAKKAAARKTPVKEIPAKAGTAKKASAKSAPPGKEKTAAEEKASSGKTSAAASSPEDEASGGTLSKRLTKALQKVSSTRSNADEDSKRAGPARFTLADVREIIATRSTEETTPQVVEAGPRDKAAITAGAPEVQRPRQTFGAVSMADILGFNPMDATAGPNLREDESIPKKFLPYYKALLDLRDSVEEGLNRHSQENLGISSREGSGDLSGYAQHMADAGTDTFERDFALSMVSTEQDALHEIDEAIARIRDGSYGTCEITGTPISRDRLKAVPFARYSVEGQREIEKNQRRRVERGGIFGTSAEDIANFSDEDADD